MLDNLSTLLGCAALAVSLLVSGIALVKAFAAVSSLEQWRETAEAQAMRLETIEGEVESLKAQHELDQTLIGRLTHQRDRLLRTVRLLTARVGQLERRLRDAGIPADPSQH